MAPHPTPMAITSLVGLLLAVAATEAATPQPLRIDGLVTAVFTPFNANGSLNLRAVSNQAAWLNETGVHWVFIAGTTGESVKLVTDERKMLVEEWERVASRYGIRYIVHVGAESVAESQSLARHAVAHGAAAIGAMPASFFRPSSTAALARAMGAVAGAAKSLPFYFYHIPSMTNVHFDDGMLGLAKAFEDLGVSNFAGVKYTGLYTYPGLMDATRLAAYSGTPHPRLSTEI
mmetsp:Transcript_17922/g.33994  ORF Transcript_17922/g.33994 Transcript_17922/m.33994 type:complete len:232 (-) Transcript_17922:639-1334(-)